MGARNPEAGKKKLFFANPWAIAFTTQSGVGTQRYAVSAGSDLLVKLNVDANGDLSFTSGRRYDPVHRSERSRPTATSGDNAGKNPQGIVTTRRRALAPMSANFVSRNVSMVDLLKDKVVKVIRTTDLPIPGSPEEAVLVGAEMFFSGRGHFNGRRARTPTSRRRAPVPDGWQNCASCHFKGWTDGVIWAFASGPRKSVNLGGSFNPQRRDPAGDLQLFGDIR